MFVGWRHRIIRVQPNVEAVRRAVLGAFDDGWIYVHASPAGDGHTDLVFRRAAFGTRQRCA